nr:MAG TPA: hypothetical protein [Caudoviricetes sp.]DAN95749.1 MAG TPA: hypothetical protein [Caudoviricetes sp.]DAV33497.1 MAG TPA: hypothetical protein [Caudoviricetes sp.]
MFGIFPSYVTDYQEHSKSSLYGDDCHFLNGVINVSQTYYHILLLN